MAFWWMFFIRVLMLFFGMSRCTSFWMECSCIAPLTPVVMVIGFPTVVSYGVN